MANQKQKDEAWDFSPIMAHVKPAGVRGTGRRGSLLHSAANTTAVACPTLGTLSWMRGMPGKGRSQEARSSGNGSAMVSRSTNPRVVLSAGVGGAIRAAIG